MALKEYHATIVIDPEGPYALDVEHSLNTKNIIAQLHRTSEAPNIPQQLGYATAIVDKDTVRVTAAAGTYKVVVIG